MPSYLEMLLRHTYIEHIVRAIILISGPVIFKQQRGKGVYSEISAVSVDDEEYNLLLIESMAQEVGMRVKSFTDPTKALEYIRINSTDMVFVDYMMPEMNGVELIKKIRQYYRDIPVIMITFIENNEELKLEALESGATEFLNKPVNVAEFKARITNLTQLRRAQILLRDRAVHLEEEVRRATFQIMEREHETLQTLGKAAEYKDPETSTHIMRVAHYARLIARSLGESEDAQDLIFNAAPLHDIGKIGIPDYILFKEGPLSKEEWDIMQTHTTIGYNILKNAKSTYLAHGAVIALSHHEMYDGTGYPLGLKGDDIHLFGRIVAVADVFDALISRRPYKVAFPLEMSIGLLVKERGSHLDPKIVDLFLDNLDEIKHIFNEYQERV